MGQGWKGDGVGQKDSIKRNKKSLFNQKNKKKEETGEKGREEMRVERRVWIQTGYTPIGDHRKATPTPKRRGGQGLSQYDPQEAVPIPREVASLS